ncbi:MAG: carbohydrate ABC transporter permease, partial [Geminicoccaceae bacterium]
MTYRRPISPGRIVTWTLLFLGGVVMVAPLLWMFSTSLKYPHEVYNLRIIPDEPTFENYLILYENSRFLLWFFNSILIATLTTLSVVFFDSLVGYVLCKFDFRGRHLVFIAILSTLMIPTEMLVIPWYVMAKNFGWL